MSPAQALDYFGTKAEIARVLGITSPSIIEWFDDGVIPEGRQYQLELVTKGALRADQPANRKANSATALLRGAVQRQRRARLPAP